MVLGHLRDHSAKSKSLRHPVGLTSPPMTLQPRGLICCLIDREKAIERTEEARFSGEG